jgi:hypothetical protein
MIHPIIKPSNKIDLTFDPSEVTKDIVIPEDSKKVVNDYLTSDALSDEKGFDMMFFFDKAIVFGFDYLHKGKRLFFIELNPTTIFYSNAIMSYGMLGHYKEKLLSNTYTVENIGKDINPNHFWEYFNLAINCIINLQATVESFLNYTIADKYIFIDKKKKFRKPTIHDKMQEGIIEVTGKNFAIEFENDFQFIKDLINIRNNFIHLRPDKNKTNTKFKVQYREIIDFDFDQTISAVEKYINYYEPNLIEHCSCGKEMMFDFFEKK